MASLKEVKGRISSVKSTQKITQAMKMVASAKLHRAQSKAENASLYLTDLRSLLARLLLSTDEVQNPYTRPDSGRGKTALVAISSNTGMCGAYNANIIRHVQQTMAEAKGEMMLFPVGRKVRDWLVRAGYKMGEDYNGLVDGFDTEAVGKALTEKLISMYLSGEVERVEILYHRFRSVSSQAIVQERILPFSIDEIATESGKYEPMDSYLFEPSLDGLIESLTLRVINRMIPAAGFNSFASEQRARTVAMQIATENAGEILDQLEIEYNKLRQDGITAELLDIIGGSFA